MNGDKTVTAHFSLIPATPTPRPTATPSAWSYYNKGEEYQAVENWIMAIGEYTRAIQVNPNFMDAYWDRGYSYQQLGQHAESIPDYDMAIQLDPNEGVLYNNRGWARNETGSYHLALQDLTKSIQLDPKSIQNRPPNDPKSIQNRLRGPSQMLIGFLIDLLPKAVPI